jgi:hypothetical protein
MNFNENLKKYEPSTIDKSIPEDFIQKLQIIYEKEFGICLSNLEAKNIFFDVYALVNALIKNDF